MNSPDKLVTSYRSRYPELYQFFAGYFYQGWASDYKWDGSDPSFTAVVRHFRAVNPPAVIDSVRDQLERFMSDDLERGADLSLSLGELGNGFNPGFEGLTEIDWLKELAEVLAESAATSVVLRERH